MPSQKSTKCQRTTESSFLTTASAQTDRAAPAWVSMHRRRRCSSASTVAGGSSSRSSSRSSSGKRAKRPQLDAALAACKKHKAKLVVAKLDRLSRNVSFLLKLIDSGVEVLFADLPELNGAMGRFMLTTMASVAELEAGLISERTKAALKAAKARGVRLGRHGAEVLAPKFKEEARQRAMELEPVITELKGKGLSLARIAVELNKRKVATPRGGKWDHSSVGNVLQRLAA